MKHKYCFAVLVIGMITAANVYAQVSTPANIPSTTLDYVGWNVLQTLPLNIKHEAALPINFYTNAGLQTFLNQRMTILGSTGHVGIGTAAPKERLEVNGSILASGKILIAEGDSVHDLLA
ncbi:MAG TPA: hypothetical protein VNJ07_11395, partial [Chitinophagales bacterium]|nr:hypothetical protein [Chitinophagales bacterium]